MQVELYLSVILLLADQNIKIYYTIFLIFHITLATIGAVLGIIMIVTGFKNKLEKHRKLGPITSIIWFFTAITGVAVYLLLYVIYRGGETTSVIKAILGFWRRCIFLQRYFYLFEIKKETSLCQPQMVN